MHALASIGLSRQNWSSRTNFGRKCYQNWFPGTTFAVQISLAGPILAAKTGPPVK